MVLLMLMLNLSPLLRLFFQEFLFSCIGIDIGIGDLVVGIKCAGAWRIGSFLVGIISRIVS